MVIYKMETVSFLGDKEKIAFYKWGTALALITIFYNIVEGVVSVAFGIRDETIALFGSGGFLCGGDIRYRHMAHDKPDED